MTDLKQEKLSTTLRVWNTIKEDVLSGDFPVTDTEVPYNWVEFRQTEFPFSQVEKAYSRAFGVVEAAGQEVGAIFINARDYADVRRLDFLNAEDQVHYLRQGLMAEFHGAQTIATRDVPAGTVYFLAEGCLDSVYKMNITR